MPIKLNDATLEASLIELVQKQPIRSNKHAIAVAILRRAVRDGIDVAHAWLHDGNGDNAPRGAIVGGQDG